MRDIFKIINVHECIFFDIYDTLIKRNVIDNIDLLKLVEREYNKRYNSKINYIKKRLLAEKKARKNGINKEVNIDEIYLELKRYYSSEIVNRLKNIEIEIEIEISTINNDVIDYYYYALSKGKKIYIISDMYLRYEHILKILYKNNIKIFEKLFVSCEERVTKWDDGKLFLRCIEKERLNKKSIVHIGNDKIADYKMALKQGIDAILIEDIGIKNSYYKEKNIKREILLDYKCLNKFISNNLKVDDDRDYKLGYEVFGPMLYAFANWIYIKAKENNIDKIFFLSRDGYIVKKAFDEINQEKNIKSTYMFCSRRTFILPSLNFYENIDNMITTYKSWGNRIDVRAFFFRFGIDINNYKELLEKYDLKEEELININDKRIKKVFSVLKTDIVKKSLEQLNLLKLYFKQINFEGKVAIVDIGAGGSIESALKKIIDKEKLNINYTCFYLYSYKNLNEKRMSLFDINNKYDILKKTVPFCYMLLELFYSAPHATVIEYNNNGNSIEPKFGDDVVNYNNKMITNLRLGAVDFTKNMKNNLLRKYISISSNLSMKNFENFGVTPMLLDSKHWGKYKFDSDECNYLAKPKKIEEYLFNLSLLKKDLKRTMWLSGFITNLFCSTIPSKLLYKLYNNKYIYSFFKIIKNFRK